MRYTPSARGPAVGLDGVDVGGSLTGDETGGCVVAGGGVVVDVEAEFVLKVTLLT